MKRALVLAFLGLLAAPVLTHALGGWVVITVDDVPDHLTVGANAVSFTVRQHGATALNDLHPTVSARSGRQQTQVAAIRGKKAGQYVANLRLASPGEWTVVVNSGFGDLRATLLPVSAVAATGLAAEPAIAGSERGRRLFVAKGCVTCHVHANAKSGNDSYPVGPELTGKRFAPEYLKLYLADPSIRPPTKPNTPRMPNLGLKPAEIGALVEFINK
jgi:hypothetical protein